MTKYLIDITCNGLQERQSMTITTLMILTILGLMLLVALVFGVLYYHRKQMQQEVANKRLIATINPEYVSTGTSRQYVLSGKGGLKFKFLYNQEIMR